MIFVTVGTHEQPFNRLIQKVDSLVGTGAIKEDVFIQRGIKSVVPMNCPSSDMICYNDIVERINNARIIITHGGPGSIMMSLSAGKIPIVVPRQAKYKEHIDDHQISFTKGLESQHKIIAVYEIEDLKEKIFNYEILVKKLDYSKNRPEHKYTLPLETLTENLENYCRSFMKCKVL
jgi:UDP-N-acetylglucosamine transferase subunit ALG13